MIKVLFVVEVMVDIVVIVEVLVEVLVVVVEVLEVVAKVEAEVLPDVLIFEFVSKTLLFLSLARASLSEALSLAACVTATSSLLCPSSSVGNQSTLCLSIVSAGFPTDHLTNVKLMSINDIKSWIINFLATQEMYNLN